MCVRESELCECECMHVCVCASDLAAARAARYANHEHHFNVRSAFDFWHFKTFKVLVISFFHERYEQTNQDGVQRSHQHILYSVHTYAATYKVQTQSCLHFKNQSCTVLIKNGKKKEDRRSM